MTSPRNSGRTPNPPTPPPASGSSFHPVNHSRLNHLVALSTSLIRSKTTSFGGAKDIADTADKILQLLEDKART